MKFETYSADELAKCRDEFEAELNRILRADGIDADDTEGWTEHVLDWFANTAGPDVLVDARPQRPNAKRETYGEFLVDLTHSTYPQYPPRGRYGYWKGEYWTEALQRPCCVRLALESEWGKAGAPGATRVAVLQDAIKVAALRADVKVVVFGPEDKKRGDALMDELATLRRASNDKSPWLLAALPWKTGSAWCHVLK